jgi:hypothetical protein
MTEEIEISFLDLVRTCQIQIKTLIEKGTVKDTQFALRDLAGHQEVINTNSEQIAERYVKTKMGAANMGSRFKDNLEVVEYMKSRGQWNVDGDAEKG